MQSSIVNTIEIWCIIISLLIILRFSLGDCNISVDVVDLLSDQVLGTIILGLDSGEHFLVEGVELLLLLNLLLLGWAEGTQA